jgi:hypothetical protein
VGTLVEEDEMKGQAFTITSRWSPDTDSPARISERFLNMIERLNSISPAMRNWQVVDGPEFHGVPVTGNVDSMTTLVEHSLQWQYPHRPEDTDFGYTILARGSPAPSDFGAADTVDISISAGAKFDNEIQFDVGDIQYETDLSIVTHAVYRASLEALVSAWPCPWALAYTYGRDSPPVDDPNRRTTRKPFEVAWIAYLSASAAVGLSPPPELLAERTPGGGVILSAVQTLIDPSSVEHMRRSRLLEAIMVERVGVSEPHGWAKAHPARTGPY